MSIYTECQRCLYTIDHPLGLTIDEHGICSGCRIHEEKDQLDWQYRWSLLEKLAKDYRSADTRHYDCIIPVSGAQDSYFIVHTVKNKLKLNPLLVSYNKYWNTPIGINNLANLRIKFNCDILLQNVNPLSVKKIVKSTLRQWGSIYWHCIAGQTVFPVQIAVRYKIPLIIWGAHQGMEQCGMFSHEHEVEMTRRYRHDHDLMGIEAEDLLGDFDSLTEGDIWQYHYPDDQDLHAVGVRGIYLNNYVRWDPKAQHEQMIDLYHYQTTTFSRTFDCYDYSDCYHYMNLHDQLKYYKHGYSKVTDHICREIRHRRLTREQGKKLAAFYTHCPIEHGKLFCEWLDVKPKGLQFVMDQHRNKNIWQTDYLGNWRLKKSPETATNLAENTLNFIANNTMNMDKKPAHITIGKGWP